MKKYAAILLVAMGCAQESAPLDTASLEGFTSKEESVKIAVLEKLKMTSYWTEALNDIEVYSVNDVTTVCSDENTGGCTDLFSVVVERETPAFCWNLVHEYLHIALHHLKGNSDAGHSNHELFYAYPNRFCSDITNPFFVVEDRCANGGFGCF